MAAPSPSSAGGVRAEIGDIRAIEGLRGFAVLWVVAFHFLVLREGKFDDAFVALVNGFAPVHALVRNGYLGVDLGAVWLVVEQDLPPLSEAVNRMLVQLCPRG